MKIDFDEIMKKFFNEMNTNVSIEQTIKASEKSKQLLKDMKKIIEKNNRINSKKYKLKMDIVDFEVYFTKTTQLSFSIFNTKNNEVFIYNNMNDEFFRLGDD